MSTLVLTHPASLEHETGAGHPESVRRIRAVTERLAAAEFTALLHREAPLGSLDDIARIHPPHYVETLRGLAPKQGAIFLDGDTVMSAGSWNAALAGVGAACAAVDAVFDGTARNAFCATRPPGHHAEAARAMGFCLFNNAAIAAIRARAVHGAERIAVLDFDVHHGNGTQASFWRDRAAFYGSSHQMPLFPGTGAADQRGEHDQIVNAPLAAGDGGWVFRQAWEQRILPALAGFSPDIIVVSAGFDAHRDDPLASIGLVEDDFAWITGELLRIAEDKCGGRLISVLEGGYNIEALAESVAAHVRALMAGAP